MSKPAGMALLAQDKHRRSICVQYVASFHSDQTGWDFMVSGSMEKIEHGLPLNHIIVSTEEELWNLTIEYRNYLLVVS